MGLFGFVGNIVSASVKIAVSPIALAADAVEVVSGNDPEHTMNNIQSAGEDVGNAVDELFE